jgi:hypothetical protein
VGDIETVRAAMQQPPAKIISTGRGTVEVSVLVPDQPLARVLAVAEALVSLRAHRDTAPSTIDDAAMDEWHRVREERIEALDAAVAALRGTPEG